MKSDMITHKGILRTVDNQLSIIDTNVKNKKASRVTFHYGLENRIHAPKPLHMPVENQLLRARTLLNNVTGDKLFEQAKALEAQDDYASMVEAFDLYKKANRLEHLESTFRLGQIFAESDFVEDSIDSLDVALDYFSKIRFVLLHPRHDDAMDYIQAIYKRMAHMHETGEKTNKDLAKALECYEMVPHRTEKVQEKIITVSQLLAQEILAYDRIDLDDLEKALELLTNVSLMRPEDTALKTSIQELTFKIGQECYSGVKLSQNLQAAFKHLEFLYAEDPEYSGLRELLGKVIKQGILPYGYNRGNYSKAFNASRYFLQFVFRKGDFQEITHDKFVRELIMESVMTLLAARNPDSEEDEEKATHLWSFVLDSYFD